MQPTMQKNNVKQRKTIAIIAMIVFIVLFFIPYIYVLRRNGLDWE